MTEHITPAPIRPAMSFQWLTPGRCRAILAIVLLWGFLSHVNYLRSNCPLDLAGDEAHYWDWSRQLDWSYYSKPPLIAVLIRSSCSIFGDTMPAVRFPAIVLAIATSLTTYWLTWKLFKSERLALGAVLLNHLVPLFIAGSVMMTIDPPLFFGWALASALAVKAIFDNARWAWIGVGIAAAMGMLSKYSMPIWFLGLVIFMVVDAPSRKHLRSPWPWISMGIMLLALTPMLVWNSQHEWVSFQHVKSGTAGGFEWDKVFNFFGALLLLGPALLPIIVGAVIYGLKQREASEENRAVRFLLCIGLTYLTLVFLDSFVAKVQPNWPAPAYFTLMILTAWFLGTRMRDASLWKPWRGLVYASIVIALIAMPVLHDMSIIYPVAARIGAATKTRVNVSRFDFSYKLRGMAELGGVLTEMLKTMPAGSMILCHDYQAASQMAFYTEGQPKTFVTGSYLLNPAERTRKSQYDIWEDRQLDQPALLGRSGIFVGDMREDVRKAFVKVEELPSHDIVRRGLTVRTFRFWLCTGFKGMHRPTDHNKF